MKQNYRFVIRYDGTRFYGWEHQPNTDMTIQGKIETVLARMTDREIELIGAGRTDAERRFRRIHLGPVRRVARSDRWIRLGR